MLLGQYSTQLGDKNRVALPRKVQESLDDRVVLTRGYEKSLILVDQKRWSRLVNEINRRPLLAMNVRDTKRFLLGGAFEIELDKQGRFVIPEALINYAGIESEIALVGVGEWLEIWGQNSWDLKLESLAETSADIADRLSELTTEANIDE